MEFILICSLRSQLSAAAHSAIQFQFHSSLPNGKNGLKWMLTGTAAPKEWMSEQRERFHSCGEQSAPINQSTQLMKELIWRRMVGLLVLSLGWVMGWWASQWLRPKKRTTKQTNLNSRMKKKLNYLISFEWSELTARAKQQTILSISSSGKEEMENCVVLCAAAAVFRLARGPTHCGEREPEEYNIKKISFIYIHIISESSSFFFSWISFQRWRNSLKRRGGPIRLVNQIKQSMKFNGVELNFMLFDWWLRHVYVNYILY